MAVITVVFLLAYLKILYGYLLLGNIKKNLQHLQWQQIVYVLYSALEDVIGIKNDKPYETVTLLKAVNIKTTKKNPTFKNIINLNQ